MRDENSYSDEWLEMAKDTFEQLVAEEDFTGADAVIKDIRDAGYEKQALVLERELLRQQNLEKMEV